MKQIRNSAKAIIIQNGRILVIQCHDQDGDFYLLPGGGQNFSETLTDAVRREVKEETSLDVQVGKLMFIREYISAHHEFAEVEPETHQIEFMFACCNDDQTIARRGDTPDGKQIDICWIPLNRLMDYRLYPLKLRVYLSEIKEGTEFKYLGDIN